MTILSEKIFYFFLKTLKKALGWSLCFVCLLLYLSVGLSVCIYISTGILGQID